MKKTISVLIIAILATGFVYAKSVDELSLKQFQAGVDYVPGEMLIKVAPSLSGSETNELFARYQLGLLKEFHQIGWMLVAVPQNQIHPVKTMISKLEKEQQILAAVPNMYRHLYWEPNDWFWTEGHLWNLNIIGMEEAWDIDTTAPEHGGDPDVIVAVIDTGCAYKDYVDNENYDEVVSFYQAPDFADTNFWQNPGETPDDGVDNDGNDYIDDINGYNFDRRSPYPCDDMGHGTHVCGTVAQSTNNDGGVEESLVSAAGIAFNCTLMPLKVFNRDSGSTTTDLTIEAILYAADNGADVINMSLGGEGSYAAQGPGYDPEREACDYAYYDKNVFIVAASGNDADIGTWNPQYYGVGYPAAFASVVAVGASNNATTTGNPFTEERTDFSQYGFSTEVVAPSGQWDSPDNDGSGEVDLIYQQVLRNRFFPNLNSFDIRGEVGTSMACPHVAGQAALIISHANSMCQTLTSPEIRGKITSTCVDINHDTLPGYDYHVGFGRINVPDSIQIEPIPQIVVVDPKITEDTGQGNGNNRPEAGERVSMRPDMMAIFAGSTNIEATLSSTSPFVTIIQDTTTYPDIPAYETKSSQGRFIFEISANCPLQEDAPFKLMLTTAEKTVIEIDFNARITPARLLFWDDDMSRGKEADLQTTIIEGLDAAGFDYEYFETVPLIKPDATENHIYPWQDYIYKQYPSLEFLNQFDGIIWFLGQQGHGKYKGDYYSTILPNMIQYLDNGGNLMITSHELLYQFHPRPFGSSIDLVEIDPIDTYPEKEEDIPDYFIYNYLKIESLEHDNYYTDIKSASADPLFMGMSYQLNPDKYNMPFAHEFNWWPDSILPREGAVSMFTAGDPVRPSDDYPDIQVSFDDTVFKMKNRCCALRYPGLGLESPFRVAILAFPLEAIVGNTSDILEPLTEWLLDGTGESASNILVDVETSQNMYTYNSEADTPYGDKFRVYGTVFNPSAPADAQRWVILDVLGEYFFWPTFTEDIDFAVRQVASGYEYENFLEFSWPDGDFGVFDGIRFWFAHLDNSSQLLGDYDYIDWGFY